MLCFGTFSLLVQSTQYSLIISYGASGDGTTLHTAAIRPAIDEPTQSGDGRVVVPMGRFLTGSIVLKNNVHFFLQDSAALLGSPNPRD